MGIVRHRLRDRAHPCALLRRLLKEHVTDDTRERLGKKVVEHLELSGLEIDEAAQIMRKRPPTHGHGDD
jgi:hypothetical protein